MAGLIWMVCVCRIGFDWSSVWLMGIGFADGFQLLHAVYAVECFLANLKKRKCNFHLIFFEGMCNPPSRCFSAPSHALVLSPPRRTQLFLRAFAGVQGQRPQLPICTLCNNPPSRISRGIPARSHGVPVPDIPIPVRRRRGFPGVFGNNQALFRNEPV